MKYRNFTKKKTKIYLVLKNFYLLFYTFLELFLDFPQLSKLPC